MDKKKQENSDKVAGKSYEPEDYNRTDELSQGLAITHEQVSDTFTEGTIDGKIDDVEEDGSLKSHDGEAIPRENYEYDKYNQKEKKKEE